MPLLTSVMKTNENIETLNSKLTFFNHKVQERTQVGDSSKCNGQITTI